MGPLALVAARPEVSRAGPIDSGAATFTACVSLGVRARVLCASVHASGWPGGSDAYAINIIERNDYMIIVFQTTNTVQWFPT